MPRYSVTNQATANTGSAVVHSTINAGANFATNIAKLYDLMFGSDANPPADFAGEFRIVRLTSAAAGTGPLVAQALDPYTPAANSTVYGTAAQTQGVVSTNVLLMISLNQRATFRWVAVPGGEIRNANASSNSGMAFQVFDHGAAPNINCTMMWEE